HREWKTGAQGEDAARLPSTDHITPKKAQRSCGRQLPNIGSDELLVNVDAGKATVKFGIVGGVVTLPQTGSGAVQIIEHLGPSETGQERQPLCGPLLYGDG